jgi:phospholipase C
MMPDRSPSNPRFKPGRTLVFTYTGRQCAGIILEVMPAYQFKDYTQIRLGFRKNMAHPNSFSTKVWMYIEELERQSVLDIMAEQIANNEIHFNK